MHLRSWKILILMSLKWNLDRYLNFLFLFCLEIREKWKVGSRVNIYSQTDKKWFTGKIAKVIQNYEEWLLVVFKNDSGKIFSKEIQRYSGMIRPYVSSTSQSNVKNFEEGKSEGNGSWIFCPFRISNFFPCQSDLKKRWKMDSNSELINQEIRHFFLIRWFFMIRPNNIYV